MGLENAAYFVRLFFALQNENRRQYWKGKGPRSISDRKLDARKQQLQAIDAFLQTLHADM